MRTYTRKRPENQVIDNVRELCRLCLNSSENMVPIFTEEANNVCAVLPLRIMICVGLEVKKEESLPNIICTECLNKLNKYYAFRKQCEVSYQRLKSHLLAVKENKHAKTDPSKQKIEKQVEVEEIKPEFSTFLSTILLQLGMLKRQNDVLTFIDHGINTMELETGDGNQVMLEFVEEDDEEVKKPGVSKEEENTTPEPETPQIEEIIPDPPDSVDTPEPMELDANDSQDDSEQNSGIVIKYYSSIVPRSTDSGADSDRKNGDYKCDTCGKSLASRSALNRHNRVHSGEKPFPCTTCGRKFAQREVMQRHTLVHEEQRPFSCEICSKSFTQRGALAAHERAHAPPHARSLEIHRCTKCPKVFLYASGLSRHMMMHMGRVYVCGACDRHFKDKSSLMRHLKKHNHSEQTVTEAEPT